MFLVERRSQYALINAVQFPRLTCDDDAVRKCRGWTQRKMYARRHVAFYTAFGIFLVVGFARVDGNANVSDVSDDGSLWSTLIQNCKRPTLSCIQDSFYKYVDDGIDTADDINFGGFVRLTRNSLVLDNNTINNTIEEKSSGKSEDGPLGDMAKTLRKKIVNFMISHDVQLQLPQTLFDGAIFKISPRSLSEDGALVNLDILPNQVWNPNGQGRIFFKKLSKFRNLRKRRGGKGQSARGSLLLRARKAFVIHV